MKRRARGWRRSKRTKLKLLVLVVLATAITLALSNCGEVAKLSVRDGSGATPVLPEPKGSLIPTVNIAPAVGWPDGTAPVSTVGTSVNAFARGLDHPRWLYVLPNGDVLVAETNAPPKPEDAQGIKGSRGSSGNRASSKNN